MRRILIATSNQGKLRDFSAAAAPHGIEVSALPGFDSLPAAVEDGATFEANARKKAEHYSRLASGELVLADDSGLEVEALGGAPGVHSARYGSLGSRGAVRGPGAALPHQNSDDAANNARLLRETASVADDRRGARFVCVIAAAVNGTTVGTFTGTARGLLLRGARGAGGFGYDPLFLVPELGKTFAELTAEEKAAVSHRGQAFRRFLEWVETGPSRSELRSG